MSPFTVFVLERFSAAVAAGHIGISQDVSESGVRQTGSR
jgi:hypothetical protein